MCVSVGVQREAVVGGVLLTISTGSIFPCIRIVNFSVSEMNFFWFANERSQGNSFHLERLLRNALL